MKIITARGHQLRCCRKSSLQDIGLGLGDGALGRKVRKRGSLFLPQAKGSVVLRPPPPLLRPEAEFLGNPWGLEGKGGGQLVVGFLKVGWRPNPSRGAGYAQAMARRWGAERCGGLQGPTLGWSMS